MRLLGAITASVLFISAVSGAVFPRAEGIITLNQATRSQVVREATRVKGKSVGGSSVPINVACGDGQKFRFVYSGSGTTRDGQFGNVPSNGVLGYTSDSTTATMFTLNSACNLVVTSTIANGNILAGTSSSSTQGDYSYVVTQNDIDNNGSFFAAKATCSVAVTGVLTCAEGQRNIFYTAGSNDPNYVDYVFLGTSTFTGPASNSQNKRLTLTVIFV